jgi:hypothetical protein
MLGVQGGEGVEAQDVVESAIGLVADVIPFCSSVFESNGF